MGERVEGSSVGGAHREGAKERDRGRGEDGEGGRRRPAEGVIERGGGRWEGEEEGRREGHHTCWSLAMSSATFR